MQKQPSNSSKEALNAFFRIVKDDVRLSSAHLSIYFVLFAYWLKNDCSSPFNITRKAIMQQAKIKSYTTYHKCVNELHSFGYIQYQSSYHPGVGSKVFLLMF